jgi:hypothetical protein
MDLSKLSANDKLALYGSIAAIVGGIVSTWGGALWISVVAGFGMLAVLFLPQLSPNTTLPGSKGSLMVVLGGAAGLFAALSALTWLGYIGLFFNSVSTILFLVALAGSLLMAWAGWKAFQAEGGKLDLRMPAAASGGAASTAAPAAPVAEAPAPPAAPVAEAPAPAAEAPTSDDAPASEAAAADDPEQA